MNVLPQIPPLFRPPVLSPRVVGMLNKLLSFAAGGLLPWPGNRVALRVCPFSQPFVPDIRSTVRWFGGIWTVEAGGVDVVRVHPLLKDLPPEAVVPDALRLAALDMLVLAALEALGAVGGAPQSLDSEFVTPESFAASKTASEAEQADPLLYLELLMPDGAQFPVRVRLPEEDEPVQALLAALTTGVTPVTESGRTTGCDVAVCVAVETGAMRLSVAECRGLAVGDILLPDDYPARENRVRLVFEAQRLPVLHCTVCGLAATIEHLTLLPEVCMTDSTPQEKLQYSDINTDNAHDFPADAENGIAVSAIDLDVRFELERRLMNVAEVDKLRPGHTVILTADPLSPVTVRIQGKAVGTGRLVDLGGVLGVQITAIS